ncbi:DpnI domain-containing protein [Flavobacterium turcicum]|nr:DpnI domain-containing protein [Flavobacterium turcicum]
MEFLFKNLFSTLMNLNFNLILAEGYKSNSQIARVLTENWVKENSYCPNCGELSLNDFENNMPVADFHCINCKEEFELKSKNGKLSSIINDGAYDSMIRRITSDTNPNFFFLTYDKNTVNNFLVIPKHFFTPEIIIKRKPLSENAKRAGWIGCNIDISKVPESGRIFIVKNSNIIDQEQVYNKLKNTAFLKSKKLESRGWILDIMICIEEIRKESFTLEDVYSFENKLKIKYPNNNHIKDKIRQQLQFLRDKGLIEFNGRGHYRKI